MTISDKNTRFNLTISKELKKKLEILAKEQNRSMNNLIEQALNLSNRAKISIEQVENEISITKEK